MSSRFREHPLIEHHQKRNEFGSSALSEKRVSSAGHGWKMVIGCDEQKLTGIDYLFGNVTTGAHELAAIYLFGAGPQKSSFRQLQLSLATTGLSAFPELHGSI
jgi:hypothetical protein